MTDRSEVEPYQYERGVYYVVEEGSLESGDYRWNPEAILSDEIPQVSDRRLRLALELADIIQVLSFPNPERGGFPGGVRAIPVSRGCVTRRPGQYSEVISEFPDDTIYRMKQWLNENHSDKTTG